MELQEYVNEQRLLEKTIRIAVENALERFQNATDYCPSIIEIGLLDITKRHVLVKNAAEREHRNRYKVGKVQTYIET